MQPKAPRKVFTPLYPKPARGPFRKMANRACGHAIGAVTYTLASAIGLLIDLLPTPKRSSFPEMELEPVTTALLPQESVPYQPASLPYWNGSGVWPSPVSLATEGRFVPIHEATRPHGKAHPQPPTA